MDREAGIRVARSLRSEICVMYAKAGQSPPGELYSWPLGSLRALRDALRPDSPEELAKSQLGPGGQLEGL